MTIEINDEEKAPDATPDYARGMRELPDDKKKRYGQPHNYAHDTDMDDEEGQERRSDFARSDDSTKYGRRGRPIDPDSKRGDFAQVDDE